MSSQNTFPRPNGARPAARPTNEESSRQPSWVNPQAQPGYAQQPVSHWPPQDDSGFQGGGGFPPQQGYGQAAPQNADYGHWSELQAGHHDEPSQAPADPYAPQFEPYVPPSRGTAGRQPALGNQQPAQWPGRGSTDPRGFDAGSYGGASNYAPQQGQGGPAFGGEHPYREPELSASDWAGQQSEFGSDPYQSDDLGFAQAEGGELDAYEDDGDYEDEDAPRSRRPLMIVAALAGAILIGGTMAYGYKKMGLSEPQGDPPIIKSEAFPAKTKPADAGGKVFPYTDTKIMGRLGDGTPSGSTDGSSTPSLPPATPDASQSASADSSADDDGGPRKVSTLVVGRDGSIQSPPDTAPAAPSQVAVPGTSLVDVFGQENSGGPSAHDARAPGRDEPLPEPRQSKSVSGDDTPAPVKNAAPVKITKLNSASKPSTTSSIDDADSAPTHSKKHLKKVARAESSTVSDAYDPSPVTSSGGGGGFVAVLASIPHSTSSRMDALKRYADMQQKYSTALSGKTPDVAGANLGAKGRYDRLIVGPPGSRQEASNVCAQLKSAGYGTCWVTSY